MNLRILLASLALPAFIAGCATEAAKDTSSTPAASSSSSPSAASSSPAARPGPGGTAAATTPEGIPARRSVYYDFDKSDIKAEHRGLVEANAKYLREHPSAKVTVEGNCDERGSREYNLALGQRRSEGVVSLMKLLGAKEGQMEAVSFGKEKPRRTGHDEQSWQENRRSDIQYR